MSCVDDTGLPTCNVDDMGVSTEPLYGIDPINETKRAEIEAKVANLSIDTKLLENPPFIVAHGPSMYPVRQCNATYVEKYKDFARNNKPEEYLSLRAIHNLNSHLKTGWQPHAREAVRRSIKAFQLARVPLILQAGTLLGWARMCDVMPHTEDIDFCIPQGYIVSQEHFALLVVCFSPFSTVIMFNRKL